MTLENRPLFVHIITHGPHCLDGVAAAVAIARARPTATILPWFVNNNDVNDAVRALRCSQADADHEVWITDVSWTDRAADRHLRSLAMKGVRLHWIDHHRSAIERQRGGEVEVPFAVRVVDESFAASRLAYNHLAAELGESRSQSFEDFWPVVAQADDTDRWVHRIEGSHELALTLRAMNSIDAYDDLLGIDREITYTPRMRAALERVAGELARSIETAQRRRRTLQLPNGLTLITSICEGYPSEVADTMTRSSANTVLALYDPKCLAVSLRRSPDCTVDLSRVARALGGGGHPAAAGCELPWVGVDIPAGLADLLEPVLNRAAG